VIVAQVLLALWGLAVVGVGASVPVHWDINGVPDGYASAIVSFAIMPLTTIGLLVLFGLIPRIEPRRANLERSANAYRTTAVAVILLLGGMQVAIVLAGVGRAVPVGILIGVGIGVLFVVLGNVMTTVRSNFLFGVRTPWTLTSDLSWDRTNRLVGRLFVLAGLTMVVLGLIGQTALLIWVMVAWIAVILVASVVYSYRVWKIDPNRRTGGSAT
jgi:uncharacterized membrane protein